MVGCVGMAREGLYGLLTRIIRQFMTPYVLFTCRILYAFARDGAVPLSDTWGRVNQYFEAPVNAVWCVVTLCFILGLPMLHSYVAFAAITSIGVIGLYISYLVSARLSNSSLFLLESQQRILL